MQKTINRVGCYFKVIKVSENYALSKNPIKTVSIE
jgi:hypothetical protein